MKKSTLLPCLLLALGCVNGNAQESKEYLRSIESEIAPNEYEKYFYDSNEQLDSIFFSLSSNETDIVVTTRKLIRDDKGNVVLRNWYQIIDFMDRYTNKIEYKYDDNNRLSERINYMDYGAGFVAQGHYRYVYDDNGLLVKKESLNVWTGGVGGYSDYSYTDGKLQEEVIYGVDPLGSESEIVLLQKLAYEYDDKGDLERMTTFLKNKVGELYETQKTEYKFDEVGNLLEINDFLNKGGWLPASSVKYRYDMNTSSDNIVYPLDSDDLEMNYSDVYKYAQNKIVQDSTWMEFETSWALYDVRNYTYESNPGTSVDRVESVDTSEITVVNDGGMIYLPGTNDGEYVYIYDVNGNLLVAVTYSQSGISVSGLPNGVKFIKVGNREAKFL